MVSVTSNLKDLNGLKQMIKILGKKVIISGSYNKEIDEIFFDNAMQIKDNLWRTSIVVTKDNISELYDYVSKLVKLDVPILLSPEQAKDNKGYHIDIELLKKQLKLIFDNKYQRKLVNHEKILSNRKADPKQCEDTTLLITKIGNLEVCSHASTIYGSATPFVFGNIFETKIKDIKIEYPNVKAYSFDGTDCLECGKCHNYACSPRIYDSIYNQIQPQVCEFYNTFYDFAINYKVFPKLDRITILMTEKCNMKCTYCFEKEFKNQCGNIDNRAIKKALDMVFKNDDGSEKKITFFGGEPSLNLNGMKFAFEYYKELKSKGLKSTALFDINTNLLVLTDELIDFIKEVKKDAFFYISVSLDGFKEINDKNRIDLNRKGTYDRVIDNAKKLREELICKENDQTCSRISICKHSVLTNENIPYIDKICETAWNQRNIFTEFSLAYITPEKGEHECLTMENLEKLKTYYDSVKQMKDLEKKEFILQYLKLLNLNENILYNYNFSLCDVISNNLSIRANGDIIPCHAFLDKINNDDYNEEIKINNILDIDINNFGFSLKNKWYLLLDQEENVKNGDLKIESELGYDCNLCQFKFLCHTCIANLKEIKGNKLIKSEEQCMRTLNQAEILLRIKETQGIIELKKLQEIEDELIEHIREGITGVGELAVGNRKILMELIKDE